MNDQPRSTDPLAAGEARISLLAAAFGPDSRDLRAQVSVPSMTGALAALETFYFALNRGDVDVLTTTWHEHHLVQLDNPVGGILRSRDEVARLYGTLFSKNLQLEVTFGDAIVVETPSCVTVAGREEGTYAAEGGRRPLDIRTTRVLTWSEEAQCWAQVHHHGSIDDAAALADYQHTVRTSGRAEERR